MENLELKQLQQSAIEDVMARISDVYNTTIYTRTGELNSLHIAAHMDIEKTTKSLNNVLTYKKEVAKRMLQCSDEEEMKQIAEVIIHVDNMIKQVLGMST